MTAALCAGCGTPAATSRGGGARPPRIHGLPADAVGGEVMQVDGTTVTVQTAGGLDDHFELSPRTRLTRILATDPSVLAGGACAAAGGERDGQGSVSAVWVLVGGAAGCGPTGIGLATIPADPVVVGGTIAGVSGRDVTLRAAGGEHHVTVGIGTAVGAVGDALVGDLVQGSCAIGRGRRGGDGRLVARRVTIVPAPTGGCFAGHSGVGALAFLDPRGGTGAAPAAPPPSYGGGGPGGMPMGGGESDVVGGGTVRVPPVPSPSSVPEGQGLVPPSIPLPGNRTGGAGGAPPAPAFAPSQQSATGAGEATPSPQGSGRRSSSPTPGAGRAPVP
jgi:hypothetical protein